MYQKLNLNLTRNTTFKFTELSFYETQWIEMSKIFYMQMSSNYIITKIWIWKFERIELKFPKKVHQIALAHRRLHQRAELCRLDQQDHYRLERPRWPKVAPPLDRRRRGRTSTQTWRCAAATTSTRSLSSPSIVVKKKKNKQSLQSELQELPVVNFILREAFAPVDLHWSKWHTAVSLHNKSFNFFSMIELGSILLMK